jgi:selenocysteine lyase/cysteine desulfurase
METPITLTDHPSVNRWRSETPGCGNRIHLNNAGAALMPNPVIEAIQTHLQLEIEIGGYEAADATRDKINDAYEAVARLIGADRSNVAIVENATVAASQALSSFDFKRGDTILTTNADYSSNQIMMLNLGRRFGVEVIRAEDLPKGGVDPESIRLNIEKHRPVLVMMTWVPTNSGLVQNAKAAGEICRELDTPFLLDACQAVGQLPVDVKELNCDFLAATSRKFLRGPRGLGFLYVSERMLDQGRYPLFPDTHGAEWTGANTFDIKPGAQRFENWEYSYALILGLGAAAEYANTTGVETAGRRAQELAAYTREKLMNKIESAKILDYGSKKCAIVTVAFDKANTGDLVKRLRNERINTSATTRGMALIDMDAKQTDTALRISPHYYNTTEEIDTLIDLLNDIA